MRALLVVIVVAGVGGPVCAQPANQSPQSLEACFQSARETDPVCSDPKNDPAQRLECFQNARTALLQCMERASHAASAAPAVPDLPTGTLSPESPTVTRPPTERPARVVDAPAKQMNAPPKQVNAPAVPTDTPAEHANAPVKPADTPAGQVDAPAKPLDAPAKQADAPSAKPAPSPASQAPAPGQQAAWVVSETTSPVDFRPLITAVIHSTSGPSTLAVRCRGLRTELLLRTERAWRSSPSGEILIAYQINDQAVVRLAWAQSPDGKTASYKQDAADLLQSLPDAAQLKISVFDGAEAGQDADFRLDGLDAVRKRLATVCKWKPTGEISSRKP